MTELDIDRVDVLKLDIEGAEWEILPALDGLDGIRTIVGELHWDVDSAPLRHDLGERLDGYEVTLHMITPHRSDFCASRAGTPGPSVHP